MTGRGARLRAPPSRSSAHRGRAPRRAARVRGTAPPPPSPTRPIGLGNGEARRPRARRSGLLFGHRSCPLAQREFLHLAGRGLWNWLEHDVAWTFVAREARPAPLDQLLHRRRMTGLHFDEGAGRLAPFLVRPRHHGSELDARMLEERVLNLDRGYVLA